MRVNTAINFCLAIVLSGCATSGVEQFYQANPHFDPAKASPSSGEPKIYSASSDINADVARLTEDGYELIGHASFNGPPADSKDVIKRAKEVGAEIVLVAAKYSHTVSGTYALPIYNPGRTVVSSTQARASTYGSGGHATGNYSGTTTTQLPGTTSYIPASYNIQRYDQSAAFFAKTNPDLFRLGAYVDDLPSDVRLRIHRNQGAIIQIVVKGTPAFKANLFKGRRPPAFSSRLI